MKRNGVVCYPGPALLFFIFRFEYLISGPKSYRDFRETGLCRPGGHSHNRGSSCRHATLHPSYPSHENRNLSDKLAPHSPGDDSHKIEGDGGKLNTIRKNHVDITDWLGGQISN